MAVSKALLTEFGIHPRLESCVPYYKLFPLSKLKATKLSIIFENCVIEHTQSGRVRDELLFPPPQSECKNKCIVKMYIAFDCNKKLFLLLQITLEVVSTPNTEIATC